MNSYQLIDSGEGRKLERFGPYLIDRPAAVAVWGKQSPTAWGEANAFLEREEAGASWRKRQIPEEWEVEVAGVKMLVRPTDFGHLGLFPEHRHLIEKIVPLCEGASFLNLFAYSGFASVAAAKAGAKVCHLDASKAAVSWAKENGEHNGLIPSPVRWIVDDVLKFLKREIRRGQRYDMILLDPPSFGRGPKGELFKIEEQINPLLELCKELLSDKPKMLALSCHTPGWSPTVLKQLLESLKIPGKIEADELLLQGEGFDLPCGAYAVVS